MKPPLQNIHRVRQRHTLSIFGLPPFLLMIPPIAVVSFTILIIGARGISAWMPVPPDPFAAYADVLPGQPASAVLAAGFSCPASSFNPGGAPLSTQNCVRWPAAGPFSQIAASISEDTVSQLRFVLRENQVRLGDLITWWGVPQIEVQRGMYYHHWTIGFVHISTRIREPNSSAPLQPISQLSFDLEASFHP